MYTEKVDYLKGLSRDEKDRQTQNHQLFGISDEHCKTPPEALPFFQTFTHDLFSLESKPFRRISCYEAGDDYGSFMYAGFDGLGLPPHEKEEPLYFPFSRWQRFRCAVAGACADSAAIPGSTMEDVVTAKADYSGWTEREIISDSLNSTVVNVKRSKFSANEVAKQVQVSYIRGGKLQCHGRRNYCVLACYNGMIPYLCPELPETQKEALSYLVKAPLVYTHVAINNWTYFQKLGIHQIVSPAPLSHLHCSGFSRKPWRLTNFPASLKSPLYFSCCARPVNQDCQCAIKIVRAAQNFCKRPTPNSSAISANNWDECLAEQDSTRRTILPELPSIVGHTVMRTRPTRSSTPDWKEGQQPWVSGRNRLEVSPLPIPMRAQAPIRMSRLIRPIARLTNSSRRQISSSASAHVTLFARCIATFAGAMRNARD